MHWFAGDDSLLIVIEAGCECYQFTWGMMVVDTTICVSQIKPSNGSLGISGACLHHARWMKASVDALHNLQFGFERHVWSVHFLSLQYLFAKLVMTSD